VVTTAYRSDIDGLRAVAVTSVVLFHADVRLFSGGYAGVDVFFVISGFLITRLLIRDLADGSFSFKDFYLRRARRLFPALFATLVLVFAVAVAIFLPFHLERLGGALISAVFWCSNVFFWTENGYFDASSSLKPLLHTWSLSVEEQFYLIWPSLIAVLFGFGKRIWLVAGIAIIGIVSFAAAELWMRMDSSAAFYLAPFRVYEFGIGALLVFFYEKKPKRKVVLDIVLLAGFALIGMTVLIFDEHTPFPGVKTLAPCLGAALIIYAGQAERVGFLLRNSISRYIGLISYSLYLVHWPVVVFYKYSVDSFTRIDKIAVIAIAVILAILMHRFVENPLRKSIGKNSSRFIAGCAVSILVLTVLSGAAWVNSGWPSRWNLPEPILEIVTDQPEIRDNTWDLVNDNRDINLGSFSDIDEGSAPAVRLLLLGDSHSKDIFNAIALNPTLYSWLDARRMALDDRCLFYFAPFPLDTSSVPSELTTRCEREINALRESPLLQNAEWILFSARWQHKSILFVEGFDRWIRSNTNAKLGIFGRTAEFKDIPRLAARYGAIEGFGAYAAKHRVLQIDTLNQELSSIADSLAIPFLDKFPIVCDVSGDHCEMVDEDENILFFDYGHWTLSGAKHFGAKMARSLLTPETMNRSR